VAADPRILEPYRLAELKRFELEPFEAAAGGIVRDDSPFPPGFPPFRGGVVGVYGYGLQHSTESIPEPRFDEFDFPDVTFGVYDWTIAFDHSTARAWAVSWGFNPGGGTFNEGVARDRLEQVSGALRRKSRPLTDPDDYPPPKDLCNQYPIPGHSAVTSSFSRDQYLAAVRKAINYVHAGDCFQVNLSQRLLAPLREHPLDLYGRLRRRNPAPYGCYFDLGEFQILSASPEQFLKVSGGEVVTRPIKGTRPRGKTPDDDARIIKELQKNPKDRAENVMIVDLLRNDLGRVCEYGSMHVPKVCEVESFAHVHHLVSEVRGTLRPDKTPFDLLRAAFPGGSVTGAPKVRAMEIIAELEPTARGPYCGSVGFVGFDGTMDSNILIRTFTAGRGWVQFPVGGGIVADSDPATEYEETLHKAKGMLEALDP
jgi:para-aminobenzoate synthetase component 1